MRNALTVVSGILFIAGFIPYIVAILKRETKPAKASWVIWICLDTLTLAGLYAQDAVNGQIVGVVIGGWIVTMLALKYGTPGWTKLDRGCLAGAVLGIALWQGFDSPKLGILTSLSVVFLGSFPTFAAAWKDPCRENRLAWTIYWLSCIVAVCAIPAWTIADAAQPMTFFAIESVMMYILHFRSRPPKPSVTLSAPSG